MANSKQRRQIAEEAARLIYAEQETEYHLAKMRAADALGMGSIPTTQLPSNSEIRQRIRQLAQQQPAEPRDGNLHTLSAAVEHGGQLDRFHVYEALLLPLENVQQNLKYHPEGDALYHSLQVFDHARDELPYDEDFLAAALLHDVGKGIDAQDHVPATLEALAGTISQRTAWLIEHHMLAHAVADRTIGSRAHRRLRESEYYEDLILLGECDRAGRQAGVEAPELEEALSYLREVSGAYG
ncbi:MAG: hypothetical protein ACR2NM_13335 [Bythopirellula sp.]